MAFVRLPNVLGVPLFQDVIKAIPATARRIILLNKVENLMINSYLLKF